MYRPSLTTVVSVLFLAYMANSMWNIVQLYLPPPACAEGELQTFFLSKDKDLCFSGQNLHL